MALKSKAAVVGLVLLLAGSGVAIWSLSTSDRPARLEAESIREAAVARATLQGRERRAPPGDSDAVRVATVIAGRVFDAGGAGAPGVTVELRDHGRYEPFHTGTRGVVERAFAWPDPRGSSKRTTRSDAHGAYRFDRLEDSVTYELSAAPPSPATGTRRWIVAREGRTRAADLAVLPASDVHGRVVDARGAGVRAWLSARVRPRGVDRKRLGSWRMPEVRTDADGRFTVPRLPDGELRLSVTAPGRRRLQDLLWDAPYPAELWIRLGGEGGGVITGHVRDAAGRAVEGARLMSRSGRPVGSEQPPYGGHVVGLATSDRDGLYRIDALPDSPVSLKVVADGFVVAWPLTSTGVNLRQEGPVVVDVTLVRSAALRGVVRSPNGAPIADALVFVRQGQGRSVRGSRTDSEGCYLIEDLRPGAAEVWAAAVGWWLPGVEDRVHREGSASPQVGLPLTLSEAGDVAERDFVLHPGRPVDGRVVDADGAPVAGAVVLARNGRPPIPNEEQVGAEVLSDAQGRFRFAGLAPRPDWRLSARKDTAQTPAEVSIDLTDGPADPLALTLVRTFAITGRVVDPEGEAVPSAYVTLDGERPPARTDAAGRFQFERVPPGPHRLLLTNAWGRREAATRDVAVRDGDAFAEIEAPARYVTTARLVGPSGKPVSGVWLELELPLTGSAGTATTDADGRFTVLGLPPGEIEVRVNGVALAQTLRAGARDARLTFPGQGESAVLAGTVWDADGQVVATADLLLKMGTPPRQTSGHYPLGGRFEIHLGGPRARIDVAVVGARDGSGKRLDVRPSVLVDADLSRPLEFRLQRGRRIRGVVADADGQGQEGVRVEVRSQASRDGLTVLTFPKPGTTTDPDGRFELVGLLDGALTVATEERAGWLPAPPVEVEAGEEDLRLTVERSASIAGLVLDPDGKPIADAVVGITYQRADGSGRASWPRTGADGRFAISVPAGVAVDVTVRASPYAFEEFADVAAGTDNLVIRGTRAPTIQGEVRGPDGESVTRALVVVLREGQLPEGERRMVTSVALGDGTNRFRAGPLAPGRYRVIARAQSGPYLDSAPQVLSAPAQGVVLSLGRGVVLRGRVLGKDLAGFHVTWLGATPEGLVWRRVTLAGPSGAFTLDRLPEEAGVILVRRDGDERCARVDGLRSDGTVDPIRLGAGLTIRGRVDQTGGRVRVSRPQVLARLGGRAVALTHADADGAFTLVGLPAGRYSIAWGSLGSAAVEAEAGTEGVILRPGP